MSKNIKYFNLVQKPSWGSLHFEPLEWLHAVFHRSQRFSWTAGKKNVIKRQTQRNGASKTSRKPAFSAKKREDDHQILQVLGSPVPAGISESCRMFESPWPVADGEFCPCQLDFQSCSFHVYRNWSTHQKDVKTTHVYWFCGLLNHVFWNLRHLL